MGRLSRMLERNDKIKIPQQEKYHNNSPKPTDKKKMYKLKKDVRMDFTEYALELEWVQRMHKAYKSGVTNQFILTGNIYDFAYEHYRLDSFLLSVLRDENLFDFPEIFKYNISTNYLDLNNENSVYSWDDMIEDIRGKRSEDQNKKAIIIDYPQYIMPNSEHLSDAQVRQNVEIHSALKSNNMITSADMVIFLAETTKDINPMFLENQSEITVIDIPYPNEEQRLDFVQYLVYNSRSSKEYQELFEKSDITLEQFARMTAGLKLLNVENILMQASYDGLLSASVIFKKKRGLIRKEFGEIVEIFDNNGLTLENFAGQEHIKNYHQEVIIDPILNGNTSIVPKGLLYVGPPGTGKTYFANCLAGSAKINFVEFKMSKILDIYVGQAEKNLERALKCFESLAPVGVFIDEIEQVLSRGEQGDNHVVKNIFSMFLSFLSNPKHRGKIIWIGATNYPNKLDEALKRPGRFDKKIPFFPPEKNERPLILKLHLNKHGVQFNDNAISNSSFVEKTDGYSQAEIENIVIKVVELLHRRKVATLTSELLDEAINSIKSSKSKEAIQEMVDIALEECNDTEFLPERYKSLLEAKK